jgi:hypothetical protein
LQLNPRYTGSYVAMACGLGMAIFGHIFFRSVTASAGELVLYGALLCHARKRQRFQSNGIWLTIEVYAGLSIVWMVINILKIQVWRWHPLAFGLTPLVVIGAYLVALLGKRSSEEKGDRDLSCGLKTKRIPLIITAVAVWAILNVYVFPGLQIMT